MPVWDHSFFVAAGKNHPAGSHSSCLAEILSSLVALAPGGSLRTGSHSSFLAGILWSLVVTMAEGRKVLVESRKVLVALNRSCSALLVDRVPRRNYRYLTAVRKSRINCQVDSMDQRAVEVES